VIVAEAHQEARSIVRTAQSERERLFAESRRVETLLRAALGMVEEARPDGLAAGDAGPETWPRREDTREFDAVSLPEPAGVAEDEPELSLSAAERDEPSPGRDFTWG
jgi:hypothetical protein